MIIINQADIKYLFSDIVNDIKHQGASISNEFNHTCKYKKPLL